MRCRSFATRGLNPQVCDTGRASALRLYPSRYISAAGSEDRALSLHTHTGLGLGGRSTRIASSLHHDVAAPAHMVVPGAVADFKFTTHPFKRAQADWLFKLFIMPPSRRDRPGQSAHKALYPKASALAVRISGARCTCDVLSVYIGIRAWNMVPRRR